MHLAALAVAVQRLDARAAARLALCRRLRRWFQRCQPVCLLESCFAALFRWLHPVDRRFCCLANRRRLSTRRLTAGADGFYNLPRSLFGNRVVLAVGLPALAAPCCWCSDPLVELVREVQVYLDGTCLARLDTRLWRAFDTRPLPGAQPAERPQELHLPMPLHWSVGDGTPCQGFALQLHGAPLSECVQSGCLDGAERATIELIVQVDLLKRE